MRLILTVAALCCTALSAANAQDIVPPEVVRLESVHVVAVKAQEILRLYDEASSLLRSMMRL